MKKLPVCFFLLTLSLSCFAQQITPNPIRDSLLLKSKQQKTAGFIMLGAGLAAAVGGGIILANNLSFNTNGQNANASGGTILFIAGTLSTVGSIFPFISSGKNKRKAMQMSAGFKMEKGMPEIKRGMSPSYYPAVSVKIPLR